MLSKQLGPSSAIQVDSSLVDRTVAEDDCCFMERQQPIHQLHQQRENENSMKKKTTKTTIQSTNSIIAPTPNGSATSPLPSIPTRTGTVSSLTLQTQKQQLPTTTGTASTKSAVVTGSLKKPIKVAAATATASIDASGRSAALERAYVHDVYENCDEPTGPLRPRVAQFLANLDPGSVVCDVGCGNGRYLTQCNPLICTIGVDRCYRLSKVAREKGGEVALCDNLELPFRDDSFDAVLSLAVVHHFATTERRVGAIRELARVLRVGGRVVITVWALEQRHRRFESQDVLIPWQPPKNRNFSCSDEEDEDDFLPPYHAYMEDSTNSSRSAGDGDSSSLSSSSPGESCYSFVRRAIQKLAGGRKNPWFLDSWTSKDTKNDSSLDYEDAKDLPIELRRLEDFEDFTDPPLSAGLKSRSLGSILNPPPRQIVRSRSSVPSLGGPMTDLSKQQHLVPSAQFILASAAFDVSSVATSNASCSSSAATTGHSSAAESPFGNGNANTAASTSATSRRPKLIKQKQSLCDDDYQLPENPFHMISNFSNNNLNSSNYFKSGCYGNGGGHYSSSSIINSSSTNNQQPTARQIAEAKVFLRKQSSLNEELMAGNRIREKERVRKRIQKQMSLNEAFLCRSMFTKRLQVIREGFANKLKTSTGSLERVTKNGLVKIMQNFRGNSQNGSGSTTANSTEDGGEFNSQNTHCNHLQQHHNHHHHHHNHRNPQQLHLNHNTSAILHKQNSLSHKTPPSMTNSIIAVTYCNGNDCGSTACHCILYESCSNSGSSSGNSNTNSVSEDQLNNKPRRHSRESGSDSSKDSSLQSDTSIESEDSFASVIFIPKPEQQQQQRNYQQQHQNSNSSSSNSSSSNGGASSHGGCYSNCKNIRASNGSGSNNSNHHCIQSVPTSPLVMPCPPTPAHSPAAANSIVTSPPQTMASVTAAMAILTPCGTELTNGDSNGISGHSNQHNSSPLDKNKKNISGSLEKSTTDSSQSSNITKNDSASNSSSSKNSISNRFTFDEEHIAQQQNQDKQHLVLERHQTAVNASVIEQKSLFAKITLSQNLKLLTPTKITRQTIKDLPPIPKFHKQHSMQLSKNSFPIIRRSAATSTTIAPNISKLMSLELFNPATDDLDSDSSEPSSPDSIDSVISAPKSSVVSNGSKDDKGGDATATNNDVSDNCCNELTKVSTDNAGTDLLTALDNIIKVNQQKCHNGDLKTNKAAANDVILNEEEDGNNALSYTKSLNGKAGTNGPFLNGVKSSKRSHTRQECADFAEQLSAQLLRELDDKHNRIDCRSLEGIGDISEFLDDPLATSSCKKRGSEVRDLTALREELRERRLMLANLSTQPSLQQSPTSSSTSSLSSQTRSLTIHEEDEEDEEEEENNSSYSLNLYENCKISKFKYKRNRHYNLNPETAYLLQDDGDSSIRDDDDDDFEHDVILEEDEDEIADAEELEEDGGDQLGESLLEYGQRNDRNTIKCESLDESPNGCAADNDAKPGNIQSDDFGNCHSASSGQQSLQNRQSTESWQHSNSSTSLDSPSQGGATTHHRYYHVFREGELDALINHHVASLHIVSSYYERASWCVVAEKVQVWTI